MPQDIDYDKLAAQHGGTAVDYDAVARSVQQQQPQSKTQPPKGWIDTAIDWLPTVGGLAGGVAGGMAGGPAGAIAGSMLGGAAGEGYKQSARFARGQAVPASEPQMLGKLGMAAAEQGAGELVGQGVAAAGSTVAQGAGRSLMNSALKPGLKDALSSLKAGKASPLVQTLLNEGVNVSERGIEKLNTLISATNDEIKEAIKPIADLPINPFRVTSKLSDTAQKFANQVNPASDLDAISKAGQEFLESHPDLTVGKAQALKQGTYQQLRGKYGELKGAEVEAQKSLARGLKDEVASEVDQSLAGLKGKLGMEGGVNITQANAREGALMSARDAVARRVAVAGRRDPMGLASLAITSPMTFVSVLMDRSPAVKSMLARGLYTTAAHAAGVSPEVMKTAIGAIAASDDTATSGATDR